MIEMPDLLLSYGVDLKKTGQEYKALCISHDYHDPSMSVYRNGSDDWVAHCFSCGFHEGAVGVYCKLNGLDVDNKEHLAQAYKALDNDIIATGKPFARIADPVLPKKPERTMIIPPEDAPAPRMDYIKDREGNPFGEPDEVYVYRQPNGLPMMYEARWDLRNEETGKIKKECRVFSYGKRGESAPAKWECAHHDAPRPLYGLDMLEQSTIQQVVITEGPRKAFYAQRLLTSIPCIGFAGGANGWFKSDWQPIAGKTAILWPDADEPGRNCMASLAQHLIDIGCTVYIIDTSAMPESWDAVDAVKEGWSPEKTFKWAKKNKGAQVEKIIEEAGAPEDLPPIEEYAKDKPIPSYEERGAYDAADYDWTEPVNIFEDFNLQRISREMLPETIYDYAIDVGGIAGLDETMVALSAVVASASMLHDEIQLQPDRTNPRWKESARLWGAVIAKSSSKKTTAIRSALSIVKKIDAECNEHEAKVRYAHTLKEKAHQSQEKTYIERLAKGEKNLDMPEKPEAPEIPRAIAQDFTIEALRDILKSNNRSILCEKDELSGWFASFDQYKQGKGGGDRAAWLEAYEGGSRRIERVGTGSVWVKNWSCSIIGGIQPETMRELAGKMSTEDGLLQRFIVLYGESGTLGNKQPHNKAIDDQYKAMIRTIWEFEPRHDLPPVYLSPEAAEIHEEIISYSYKLIGLKFVSTAMEAHLGKWGGLSARLMLAYHACECAIKKTHPQNNEISAKTAAAVYEFMTRMLLAHETAFYTDIMGGSEQQKHFHAIANLILANHNCEISLRDIARGWIGWHRMPEYMQAAVIQRLIDAGWIAPAPDARRNSKLGVVTRYLINPNLHTYYAAQADAERKRRAEVTELIKEIRTGNK
jgi:hypothetical protein